MHASGYLTKPVMPEDIAKEIDDLRRRVKEYKRMRVQTFGKFEVHVEGKQVDFKYSKAKELFAYLINCKGALCTVNEMLSVLFEDDYGHETYFKSIRKDLLDTFEKIGCSDVIVKPHGKLGVVPEMIDCDYFRWIDGDTQGLHWCGEYMSQYS